MTQWSNNITNSLYNNGYRDPQLFVQSSQLALGAGDYSNTEKFSSFALEGGGDNADALSLRSAARFKMGNIEGARSDALAAGRLDPSNKLGQTMVRYIEDSANGPGQKNVDGAALARMVSPSAGGLEGGRSPSGSSGVGVGGVAAGMIGSERSGGASFATMTPSGRMVAEAEGLSKIGDLKGALKQATLAIDADKRNPDAYAARAGIWNKLQRYLLAEQDANSALSINSRHQKALDARAFAYNMTGHPNEAQADALKVLSANPRDAMGYLNLAISQEALGDIAKAKENYEKAAQLDPSMKVFYEEFLSKHPEMNDGGAAGGAMAILPQALRSKKGAAGAGLALLGLGAAAFALYRKKLSQAQEQDSEAEHGDTVSVPQPDSQGAETIAYAGGDVPQGAAATLPAGNGAPTLLQGAGTTQRSDATVPASGLTGPNGGRLIARTYEIRKELGRGGMGVVYEAFDTALNRKVALKEMRTEIAQSTRDKERFLAEARTVAKFQHPNIVSIYNILEDGGRTFLVFEHVEGGGLDKILDEHRKLGPDAALPLLNSIAAALDYSHSRKVIHRDLKPSNIMITDDGVVKVMDFGIAHEAKQTVSRLTNAEAFGTMAYMPPEQELGQASRESDVFAFAVLAYETLLGTLPFPGPNFLEQKKRKLFKRPSQVDPTLPPPLDAVFEKALEPAPGDRYQSAGAFASAVASALSAAAA
jgi:tetratricopeptide (TPR) repeat protein/tRNA A-37 threonylcarbamoyl transferase component Bud32